MASTGKRSSYDPTVAAPDGEERPRSFYDNLTAAGSSSTGPAKIIQIPDIQFKFDDDIPITADPRRSTLMSNARSDFFGLSRPCQSARADESAISKSHMQNDESQHLLDDRRTPPTIAPGTSSSSSPDSTASTAPARSCSPGPGPVDDPAESGSKSRPLSSNRNITIRLPETGTPSEAVYMTTTVPQNFSKNTNNLIGRHKPTRSSLRHSRMLVVNKAFHQRYPRGNALNLKHIRLSRTLMVLKVLIGTILTLMGMAIMVWSPSTHTKDNPYWAGLILILCGSMFLILFDFKRRPASRVRENCFNFIRINALVLLLLTVFFTMLAFIYALLHTVNLSSSGLRCEPEYSFNVNSSSCVCWIDVRRPLPAEAAAELRSSDELEDANSTVVTTIVDRLRTIEQLEQDGAIRLEYRDFNCSEVLGIWYYVTLGSALLNSLGCLLAAGFLVIYGVECQRRDNQLKYFTVRTNGNGARLAQHNTADEGSGGGGESSEASAACGKPPEDNELLSSEPPTQPESKVTESIDLKTTQT
ncbi:uncharacterized protein LOC128732343 [Sabethes cyaneus]|uniref:uncharacterized protein LOC128732343 n=1 Tax=Sabethes cyaneus TaxID=53552 RepID=UPI00237DBAC7|nr:uncharacterized protein LOC128732343 [Sabethes cyaneus]